MNIEWKTICKNLQEAQDNDWNEEKYLQKIYVIFRHYLQWNAEIRQEVKLQAGTTRVRADFIVYKNNEPQFIIEAKRPRHEQMEEDREQLFSYMHLQQVPFGLYIGKDIRLYFNSSDNKEKPALVFLIRLEEEDKSGADFIHYFHSQHYDVEQLHAFCYNKIKTGILKRKLRNEILFLQSEDGMLMMEELLRNKYHSEHFPTEWIDLILNNISVHITSDIIKDNPRPYSIVEKREEYTNAYKKWTKEEDKFLFDLYIAGKNIRELMGIFKRNEGGIRSILKKFGIEPD